MFTRRATECTGRRTTNDDACAASRQLRHREYQLLGSKAERVRFRHAERPIPQNALAAAQRGRVRATSFGANVGAHAAMRHAASRAATYGDRLRASGTPGRDAVCEDDILGQVYRHSLHIDQATCHRQVDSCKLAQFSCDDAIKSVLCHSKSAKGGQELMARGC